MSAEPTKPLPKIIFENLSNNEDILKNGAVLVEDTSSSPEALAEKNVLDNSLKINTVLSSVEKTRYKNIGLEFNKNIIDNFNKRLLAEKNEQEMLIEDDKDTILESLKDSVKERLKNKIKNSGQNNNELMGKLLLAGLAIGSIGAFIKEKVEKWWGNIREFFDNFFKNGLSNITGFFTKPFNGLEDLSTKLLEAPATLINKITETFESIFSSDAFNTMKDGVETAFSETNKVIKDTFNVSEGNAGDVLEDVGSRKQDDFGDAKEGYIMAINNLKPEEVINKTAKEVIEKAIGKGFKVNESEINSAAVWNRTRSTRELDDNNHKNYDAKNFSALESNASFLRTQYNEHTTIKLNEIKSDVGEWLKKNGEFKSKLDKEKTKEFINVLKNKRCV